MLWNGMGGRAGFGFRCGGPQGSLASPERREDASHRRLSRHPQVVKWYYQFRPSTPAPPGSLRQSVRQSQRFAKDAMLCLRALGGPDGAQPPMRSFIYDKRERSPK